MRHLVLCSKSPWIPAMRREHAIAESAWANGLTVDFVESPADVRSLRTVGAREWARRWSGPVADRSPRPSVAGDPLRGLTRWVRTTPVPGHRLRLAATLDNSSLARVLRSIIGRRGEPCVLVATLPWQWQALGWAHRVVPGCRRVFDAADDWTALLGGGRSHVHEAYRRIAAEADEVIVANPGLGSLFEDRAVSLVPNGVPTAQVASRAVPQPGARRMIYIGTLSERFDLSLVERVLELLPDWTLDVYGPCRYAGLGERAPSELFDAQDRSGRRLRWHGLLEPSGIPEVVDGADVAVLPHRAEQGRGQSSMKLLQYAARGRPIVSTDWDPDGSSGVPSVRVARSAEEFARAVQEAAVCGDREAEGVLAWARRQTWQERWPAWWAAASGSASRGDLPRGDATRSEAIWADVTRTDVTRGDGSAVRVGRGGSSTVPWPRAAEVPWVV